MSDKSQADAFSDWWRVVTGQAPEDPEMAAQMAAIPFADVVAMFMGVVYTKFGHGPAPTDPIDALREATLTGVYERAMSLAHRFNPGGWADEPQDDEIRRSVVLAKFEEIREPPTCICGAHDHIEPPDFWSDGWP